MTTQLARDSRPTESVPADAWETVDLSLLDEQQGAPPPFPSDVLPPLWRRWTQDATARTGAPADYVALSLLTAAAGLIPNHRVVAAPGWIEPCVLWSALVGPPSCGKTSAVEAASGLLREVWRQRRLDDPHGRVVPEPFTNGTTIDVLLDAMCQSDSRGTLLVRDEQGGWLAHMARGTRDGSAHAFWLSAWCQRSLDFGWRGKTVELDEPSLSILGTAHPDTLVPALTRDDGGVLSRFLFVRPAATAGWRPLSRADDLAPAAVAALQRLHERGGREHDLSLTGEAYVAFERFRRAHCAPMADLAGKAAAWWGKGPSQVLRLAGVLTFLDWAATPQATAAPEQVPAWALEAAVHMWRDYLWPHAQATFRLAGTGGERECRTRQILRWLRAQRRLEVSREHIRREALSQAVDAAGADRLIADLVEGGWLQPVKLATGGRGRRRRRWQVHPDLLGAGPLEARYERDDSIPAISANDSHAAIPTVTPATRMEVEAGPHLEEGGPSTFDRHDSAPAISAIPASDSDAVISAVITFAGRDDFETRAGEPSPPHLNRHARRRQRRLETLAQRREGIDPVRQSAAA